MYRQHHQPQYPILLSSLNLPTTKFATFINLSIAPKQKQLEIHYYMLKPRKMLIKFYSEFTAAQKIKVFFLNRSVKNVIDEFFRYFF